MYFILMFMLHCDLKVQRSMQERYERERQELDRTHSKTVRDMEGRLQELERNNKVLCHCLNIQKTLIVMQLLVT